MFTTVLNPSSVRSLLLGEVKITNALRELMGCFQKGQIPKKWKALHIVSSRMGLGTWIADLAARGASLDKYRPVLNKSSSVAAAVQKVNGFLLLLLFSFYHFIIVVII